jgi:hypothetical protein
MRRRTAVMAAAAERLPVVKHKAMIKPPSEAVHHKPVFHML